jgi:predicted Zn-dependent protease
MNPRIFLGTLAACALASAAFAIDFGKLGKALQDPEKLKKGIETINDAKKVVSGIGAEEEQALGETVALEIISQFGGLVRDEEIVQRVNLIGRTLATYSARPDHAWRFGVLNSDSVNAFSAPDGFVLITRGLYETAENDDQLAAILGHEIIHITGRDALRIIESGEKGTLVMKHVSMRSGDMRQVEAYAKQLGVNTEKVVKFLVERGYDHPTEFAADKHGHTLAATAGYAPGGLRAVLVRLQQVPVGPQKKIFTTHPPLTERIKRLPAGFATTPSVAKSAATGTTPAAKDAVSEVDDDDRAFAEAAEKKPARNKQE